MNYKKPKMVAKSVAKKSYVAGCPEKTIGNGTACWNEPSCEIRRVK